jgi:hypothetical protein
MERAFLRMNWARIPDPFALHPEQVYRNTRLPVHVEAACIHVCGMFVETQGGLNRVRLRYSTEYEVQARAIECYVVRTLQSPGRADGAPNVRSTNRSTQTRNGTLNHDWKRRGPTPATKGAGAKGLRGSNHAYPHVRLQPRNSELTASSYRQTIKRPQPCSCIFQIHYRLKLLAPLFQVPYGPSHWPSPTRHQYLLPGDPGHSLRRSHLPSTHSRGSPKPPDTADQKGFRRASRAASSQLGALCPI